MEKVNASPRTPIKRAQHKAPKKKHGTDFAIRIIAVIAAIIVWFILSITQYPTVNRTITSVPVTLSLDGTIAKEKGLSALNFKDASVDVEIKGMNYEIGNYTADDLNATLDISKVTKEGQYDLEIDVKSTHPSDSCSIVSVSPSKISVTFDRITEKQIELEVDASSISAQDGYTLKTSNVSPNVITLTGPENNLSKISRAVAQIKQNSKLTEDTSIKADEIVLYDKDNNVITDSSITRDETQTFTVNFIVYKKKNLKLKVDVSGAPDNFDVSSMPMSYTQEEVTIITPKLNDSTTETVTIGTLPLSQIRLGKTETFDIPLSAGEENLSGESKVTVTCDSQQYTTGVFRVSSIVAKNKPKNKNISIETVSLPAVTLIGPIDDINNINESDLVASVDLSDITNNGSYSKAATISISNHDKVWCYGNNEVQVVVSDQSSTVTTTSTD